MKTARKKLRKNYAKTIAKGFKIYTHRRWNEKKQKQIEYRSKKDLFFINDDYSSKRTIKDSQRRLCKKLGVKRLRKIQNLYPHHPNIYGLFKLVSWGFSCRKENNFSFDIGKIDEILAMFDSGRVDLSKLGLTSWEDRKVIKDIECEDGVYILKNIYELYVLHANGFMSRVDTSKICNTIEHKNHKYYPSNNYEVMALCQNESIDLKDIDISNTTSLDYAFLNSKRSDFSGVNEWDTSHIKSMRSMFSRCGDFNEKLSFDTSSVEDFSYMFYGCTKFNQKINFDFSNVIATCDMFKDCISFNQEINANNSKELLRTCSMFSGCKSFDSKVVLDTHKVHNMAEMFNGCVKFNQRLDFDTSSLANIREMFRDCVSFNQEFIIKNDCLYNVRNTFNGCINLAKKIHLSSKAELEYEDTFNGCEKLKNINIQTYEIYAN